MNFSFHDVHGQLRTHVPAHIFRSPLTTAPQKILQFIRVFFRFSRWLDVGEDDGKIERVLRPSGKFEI